MGIELAILVLLILLNAFFAASEIALISLNDNKVNKMAAEGNRKAEMIAKLLSEPSRFLATIQIGITFAGFMASALAADSYSTAMSVWLRSTGLPGSLQLLETISLVGITMILSYFTLIFGELVPKRLAMQRAETVSLAAIWPLFLLSKSTAPIVKLLSWSTNTILRIFGVDLHKKEEEEIEEEIRMLLAEGRETGSIQEMEELLITKVFEFNNKPVAEIMVPLQQLFVISSDQTLDEISHTVKEQRFSRFPVYESDVNHIIGTLHVKDLFRYKVQQSTDPFNIRNILQPPYFAPEFQMLDELFQNMQQANVHSAIIIDSDGKTCGMVTLEDLLEELVGDIKNEFEKDQ
ncbi:MAG TPA: hemolysin family protein [Planococcus sp. (in: firmicutes)]|nr:hemolysin family protein [Planococcus sp. (in: firmicutes)]